MVAAFDAASHALGEAVAARATPQFLAKFDSYLAARGALAARAGEFVPREEILLEVWGSAEFVDHNIAEQYISYLRRKLAAGGASVEIVTRRGAGYRLGVKP